MTTATALPPALAMAQLTDYSTLVAGPNGSLTFDLTGAVIRGAAVVLEWVRRAWFTAAGSLPWAPAVGFDLASLENVDLLASDLPTIQSALVAAARDVDYVLDCSVGVTLIGRTLTARGRVTLVDGRTYPLEVSIALAGDALRAQASSRSGAAS